MPAYAEARECCTAVWMPPVGGPRPDGAGRKWGVCRQTGEVVAEGCVAQYLTSLLRRRCDGWGSPALRVAGRSTRTVAPLPVSVCARICSGGRTPAWHRLRWARHRPRSDGNQILRGLAARRSRGEQAAHCLVTLDDHIPSSSDVRCWSAADRVRLRCGRFRYEMRAHTHSDEACLAPAALPDSVPPPPTSRRAGPDTKCLRDRVSVGVSHNLPLAGRAGNSRIRIVEGPRRHGPLDVPSVARDLVCGMPGHGSFPAPPLGLAGCQRLRIFAAP